MTGRHVTIRPAFPDDAAALARLAALDSARLPAGPLLVAEVEGELWAAVPLAARDRAIADPFRPSGDLVVLLRQRARQLALANRTRRRPPALRWPRADRGSDPLLSDRTRPSGSYGV
jgi:hypothetical protein